MEKKSVLNVIDQIFQAWAHLDGAMPNELSLKCYDMNKQEDVSKEEYDALMQMHREAYKKVANRAYLKHKQLDNSEMKFVVVYYRERDEEGIWTGYCARGSDGLYHRDIAEDLLGILKEQGEWVWIHGGGRIEIDREAKILRAYGDSGTYGKFSLKQVTRILKRMMEAEGLADFQLIVE